MNTMTACMMGEMNRGKELKVFDWNKAATLIKEKNVKFAAAGLSGDWEYTGGTIFIDGKPDYDDYTYLASTWAAPELKIDGEYIDCYLMQSETDNWDSETKWPQSAIDILNSK
ncbi:hypothetical protein [Paenibacillus cremeus]|uniref:Uncharacterized protein n=1 Tax=Paenibacillus cremeus TaxID=2163881 RepID=A0A559KCH4_9BACL|nr:hypothetical protein [Paenibacillus cremeus]TVY09828.1 hypothetical protein FPZ49_10660 [Paenibacillus cremeus]